MNIATAFAVCRTRSRPSGGLQAHINVPPPAPPGPFTPPEEQPITVPTPEGTPPEIDEPVPEPVLPIREPGVIRPPQATRCGLRLDAGRMH